MNRFILLLLVAACVVVVVTDVPKPSVAANENDAGDEQLEVKTNTEFCFKTWTGPRMWSCVDSDLSAARRSVCSPRWPNHYHKRDDDDLELLANDDAKTFLASPEKRKIDIFHEECCHEGCYWEEIIEYC